MRTPRIQYPISTIVVALLGLAAGFGLSRLLFEFFPLTFGVFGDWPATLGLALLLAAGLVLGSRAWVAGVLRLHLRRGLPLPTTTSLALEDVGAHLPLLLALAALPWRDVVPLRTSVLLAGAAAGCVACRAYNLARHRLISPTWVRTGVPAALFALLLWLYLKTIAPAVGQADTFEFQVNVVRLGINHGSGYPLFMLLAKLFSWLPVGGTVAYRINLASAVFGASSVVVAYALARTLAASRGAAALAALSLGASVGLWSRAVEAEVYTLNVFLVGLILWLLLRITNYGLRNAYPVIRSPSGHTPRSTLPAPPSTTLIPLLGLALGLSFANHLTTGLLGPAIVFALLVGRPRVSARAWLLSLGLFVSGLLLYLYLPLRWPAVNHGELLTLDQFLGFLTGREAHGAVRPLAFVQDFSRYGVVGRKVLAQFGWAGVGLGALGLFALARRDWRAAGITALAWAAYAYFGLSFYVPDPDFSSFLLPAHLLQAAWIALGIHTITNYQLPISSIKYPITYTLFALLPLSNIWLNYERVDKSRDWGAYRLGREILAQPLAEGAAILADSEKIAPLYYLQIAEGLRPDLDIVVLPDEAAYRAELDRRLVAGQTVYLGRYLPHLADAYHLRSVGPLTEASLEQGAALPAGSEALRIRFGEQIELSDAALQPTTVPAGDSLNVTLAWRARAPPDGNYLVRFRLLDAEGTGAVEWPASVPVGEMYPTAAWETGSLISDYHTLPVDIALTPESYTVQVGLFPPFSEAGLPLPTGGVWADIGNVAVAPPAVAPPVPHPLRVRFGDDLWLLGYDAPEAVAPGSEFDVVLYWGGASTSPAAAELFDADERLASVDIPRDAYLPGATIPTRARLTAPAEGSLALAVQSAGAARCGWLAGRAQRCALATVRLEGAATAPGAVNFDNQIVLEDLRVENVSARPGDTVVVTAQWRGLRAMRADYTVFVHLLGPDGLVHGQVDAWPVQGTLPTTQWVPGQAVQDRFQVVVPPDAPPGEYQVEVGWYLLATLERLPVLGAGGAPVDDRYLARGLTVR